ncbi:BRO-c [Mamestra configurata nucleopolyhedrovirus A]|uniref:BRO-c n=1 Tax=Mamestra configurata nucleopolyhedrovirus TaxID=207830 RepID=Q8QLK3_NPVMC|nr:BRO-c [Mamestra configurata nucleopolyhedrovirus A]AAM09139.1 BRO-c [Mamestra configurata nucleopolyhedrovirus A]
MSLVKKSCNIGGVTAEIWIVEIEKEKFMYGGHGVAQFLGYVKPRNALQQHVKPAWRKNWEKIKGALNQGPLMTSLNQDNIPVNWQPNTVFISEAGVYALIMRSKLPAADEFRSWLFEEVLPELRKTGKYSVQDNVKQSSSTKIVNYDKKLAEAQMEAMKLKLKLSEAHTTIAKCDTTIANFNTTISEMKRNYEHQMAECKDREYKMKLQMQDLANAANMTMTQFAVNALLAKDNIEENEQMRQTLTKISNRVVPALTEQPHKEEYITGYERMVNGKRRIRMCRTQLNEIEQQNKAIQRYREESTMKRPRMMQSKRYAWLRDSEKFLQLQCPNPVIVWLKVRIEDPYMFEGLRYTNKLKTEMEVLTEGELRNKYRSYIEMCERNKVSNLKIIKEFKALKCETEEEYVAKCLTPSAEAKERINAVVEKIVKKMSDDLMPNSAQRNHNNADTAYTADQVIYTMNNCQNYFVKNIYNINLFASQSIKPIE